MQAAATTISLDPEWSWRDNSENVREFFTGDRWGNLIVGWIALLVGILSLVFAYAAFVGNRSFQSDSDARQEDHNTIINQTASVQAVMSSVERVLPNDKEIRNLTLSCDASCRPVDHVKLAGGQLTSAAIEGIELIDAVLEYESSRVAFCETARSRWLQRRSYHSRESTSPA